MSDNRRRATDNELYAGEVYEQAAERAVRKVFAILGVDVDKPESVEEFREDLRFGRRLRKAADHGILVLVGVLIAGITAAIWAGVVSSINGHKG